MIIDDLRHADQAPAQDVPVTGVPDANALLTMIDGRIESMSTTELDHVSETQPASRPPRRGRLLAAAAAFSVVLMIAVLAVTLFSPGSDVANGSTTTVSDGGLTPEQQVLIDNLAVEWSSGNVDRFLATISDDFGVTGQVFTAEEALDQLQFDVIVGQEIEFYDCQAVFSITCSYRSTNDLLSAAKNLQPIQASGVQIVFDDAGLVQRFSANVALEPLRGEWAEFVLWLEGISPVDAATMGDWHRQTISQSPNTLGRDVAETARSYFDDYATFVESN